MLQCVFQHGDSASISVQQICKEKLRGRNPLLGIISCTSGVGKRVQALLEVSKRDRGRGQTWDDACLHRSLLAMEWKHKSSV